MRDPLAPARLGRRLAGETCQHHPRCPDALAPDRTAARAVASHPEQEWSLLYNGVVLFGDGGTFARVLPRRRNCGGLSGSRALQRCLRSVKG
ncbi:MAG: DUF5999 family protein [Micromonosporaceae bacterium]